MSESPAFERAAEELERLSGLARLAARGILRLALKSVGLDARTATALQMKAITEKLLPPELESRGIADAAALCAKVCSAIAGVEDTGPGRSPIEIFERLGGGFAPSAAVPETRVRQEPAGAAPAAGPITSGRDEDVEPSIKGSVVEVTLEDLRGLVRNGTLRADEVREALGAEAASFALDEPILVSKWYPVRLYDAVLRFVARTQLGGIERLADSGRRTARALIEKGVYAQLHREPDGRADAALARLIITLSKTIYNFTTWELAAFDGDAFEIAISGAEAYPDTLMWRNVGFVEVATTQATGHPWTVRCERPTRDRVRLLVTRTR